MVKEGNRTLVLRIGESLYLKLQIQIKQTELLLLMTLNSGKSVDTGGKA